MTAPAGDSTRDELLQAAAHLVMRTAAVLDPVRLQAWEEMGLTLAQLRILFRVRAQPGADVRRIAADIGITPSAVSQQVDKLVTRGLLSRQDKPEDRRYVQLQLTEAGHEATGQIRTVSRERVHAMLAHLSDDELRDLRRSLSTFLAQDTGWHRPVPTTATSSEP